MQKNNSAIITVGLPVFIIVHNIGFLRAYRHDWWIAYRGLLSWFHIFWQMTEIGSQQSGRLHGWPKYLCHLSSRTQGILYSLLSHWNDYPSVNRIESDEEHIIWWGTFPHYWPCCLSSSEPMGAMNQPIYWHPGSCLIMTSLERGEWR